MLEPGLGALARELPAFLQGARVGLVAHPASRAFLGGRWQHAVEIIRALEGLKLVRLFGPEHGLWGGAPAGEAVADGVDPRSGLPVVSLYGARRAPERGQLEDLDALLFDLQDVGVRAFTYLSTLRACLGACAEAGVRLVVLERPNPLGRRRLGPGVAPGFESFVGAWNVPFVHGRTLGELAGEMARALGLKGALTVIPCRGWEGESWDETGLPWTPPSPNLPSFAAARLYPATVFLEGTPLSEGRGTARPFSQLGAPWLDGGALAVSLSDLALPGVAFRPVAFVPQASKHRGEKVCGVRLLLRDWARFDPLKTAEALLREARRQAPGSFAWLAEEGGARPFVDVLYGSSELRGRVEAAG